MTEKKLFELFRNIDEDHIINAAPNGTPTAAVGKPRFRIIAPIAAAFMCILLVGGIFLLPLMNRGEPPRLPPRGTDTTGEFNATETPTKNHTDTDPSDIGGEDDTENETYPFIPIPPPVFEDAFLSASDVLDAFSAEVSAPAGATTAYTVVRRNPDNPFTVTPLPTGYVNIYKINRNPDKYPLDKGELTALSNSLAVNILSTFGRLEEDCVISESKEEDMLVKKYAAGNFNLIFSQKNRIQEYGDHYSCNEISVSNAASDKRLYIGDKGLYITKDMTDSEILSSLEPIKEALFAAFGVSFDSVYIQTNYNSFDLDYSGIDSAVVYYYNSSDELHMGDNIRLQFMLGKEYPVTEDEKELGILDRVSVTYEQRRSPRDETYTVSAIGKLISLKEAEQLLNNGYVFGGHSCLLCMSRQTPITFDSYDHVEFEYLIGEKSVIPFYTFYKKIGNTKNGNCFYAKTYVCAVGVKDYEQYYEAQEKYHDFWASADIEYSAGQRYDDIKWTTSKSTGEKYREKTAYASDIRFPVDKDCAILVAKADPTPYSTFYTMDGRGYKLIRMEVLDSLSTGYKGSFLYAMPEDVACDLSKFDSLILALVPQTESLYTDETFDRILRADLVFHAPNDAPEQWNILPFTDGVFDSSAWEVPSWKYAYDLISPLLSPEHVFTIDEQAIIVKHSMTFYEAAAKIINQRKLSGAADIPLIHDFIYHEAGEAIYYAEPFYNGYFDVSFDGETMVETRYLNGCRTNEQIIIYRENGLEKVKYADHQFTKKELLSLPDLSTRISSLDLSAYSPKNIDTDTKDMRMLYCVARGWYEKTDDGVECIIKIYWEYAQGDVSSENDILKDSLYLRLKDGSYETLTSDELRAVIGDSLIFSYGE